MIAADRIKTALPLAAVTVTMLAAAGGAQAATAPVKLIPSSHFGREVNLTEVTAKGGPALEDVCTVASENECQRGLASSISGGFEYPAGVAVNNDPTKTSPHYGNVYVADRGNGRVQELTATGAFVSMFGREVNETKDAAVKAKGGTPTPAELEEENVCTALSGDVCKAGVPGTAAGQLDQPESLAVDPSTGDVHVAETIQLPPAGHAYRVQKFTAAGRFVLMVGREVNETKDSTPGAGEAEKNLCTAASGDVCKAAVEASSGSAEHGAFRYREGSGHEDLLAVGPGHLLYVGDEHRVQEFTEGGTWVRELSLTPGGTVGALAVDESGDVYLTYPRETSIVRELGPGGEQLKEFPVEPSEPNARVEIGSLALDSSGHLAVIAQELGSVTREARWFGSLYDATTGRRVTEFTGFQTGAIGFSGNGELYAVESPSVIAGTGHEVLVYKPVPVAELVVGAATCKAGMEHETSETFDCALEGTVDAWGVKQTQVWFQWGKTSALGSLTPKQPVANFKSEGEEEALVKALTSPPLAGLRPNETYYYQLAGEDHNVQPPELLASEKASVGTALVAPRVVGVPSVPFVTASSAVMFGELNPENASTEYFFEYAPEYVQGEESLAKCAGVRKPAGCPGVATTATLQSETYGKVRTTLEATGLQPGTLYHYRLFAEDENTAKTERLAGKGEAAQEGSFTTAPAPVPRAQTGSASAISATGAIVSGSVNPDGLPATYAFELGVYNGAGTQYGIVFSGPAGTGVVPIEESLGLTGLQSGTTYAYRIKVSSGYGTATGEPVLFTTAGLPSVLELPAPLAQLAIPAIAFPAEAKVTTTKPPPRKKKAKKKAKKGKGKKKARKATKKNAKQ